MKEDLPTDEISPEKREHTQAQREQEPDTSHFTKSLEREKPHLYENPPPK